MSLIISAKLCSFNGGGAFFRKVKWMGLIYIALNVHNVIHVYTGWPRRNVPDFGRVFLMLKYTDISQNTYVQI